MSDEHEKALRILSDKLSSAKRPDKFDGLSEHETLSLSLFTIRILDGVTCEEAIKFVQRHIQYGGCF